MEIFNYLSGNYLATNSIDKEKLLKKIVDLDWGKTGYEFYYKDINSKPLKTNHYKIFNVYKSHISTGVFKELYNTCLKYKKYDNLDILIHDVLFHFDNSGSYLYRSMINHNVMKKLLLNNDKIIHDIISRDKYHFLFNNTENINMDPLMLSMLFNHKDLTNKLLNIYSYEKLNQGIEGVNYLCAAIFLKSDDTFIDLILKGIDVNKKGNAINVDNQQKIIIHSSPTNPIIEAIVNDNNVFLPDLEFYGAKHEISKKIFKKALLLSESNKFSNVWGMKTPRKFNQLEINKLNSYFENKELLHIVNKIENKKAKTQQITPVKKRKL